MSNFSLGLNELNLGSRVSKFNISCNYKPQLQLTVDAVQVKKIANGIDLAFIGGIRSISDVIRRNLGLAIMSNIWASGNGLSDIYLSGDLLRSQEVNVNDDTIEIGYDVPYAALIYYGGYITPYGNKSSNKVYIPPRPWIQAVVEGMNGIPEINYEDILYSGLRGAING